MKFEIQRSPANEATIERIEKEIEIAIPTALRNFYMSTNGGKVTDAVYEFPSDHAFFGDQREIVHIYPATREKTLGKRKFGVRAMVPYFRQSHRLPQEYLPFADDSMHDVYVANNDGNVVLLNMFEEGYNPENEVDLNVSVGSFLAQIQSPNVSKNTVIDQKIAINFPDSAFDAIDRNDVDSLSDLANSKIWIESTEWHVPILRKAIGTESHDLISAVVDLGLARNDLREGVRQVNNELRSLAASANTKKAAQRLERRKEELLKIKKLLSSGI